MATKNINFNQIVDALLEDNADFPISYMMTLSDISIANLEILKKSWVQISPARKVVLMENIELIQESDITSNFEDIAILALDDVNASVRTSAVRLFWDYENAHYVKKFIDMLFNDLDLGVRSQAAITLGKYMYLAEVESIHEKYRDLISNNLIKILRSDESELVRQKALEAIGYSSCDEAKEFINNAYNSGDYNWITSSLEAIGRSADDNYASLVLPMLAHPDLRVQKGAIFAAGELELKQAKKLLQKMVMELEQDDDIWVEAISALSKIGGDGVLEVFQRLLEDAETDEEEEFLNEAIENLNLTNDMLLGFDLMGLNEPEEDKFKEINLEDDNFDLDDYGKSWIEELEEKLDSQFGDEFDAYNDNLIEDDDEEENQDDY
ncbi:MAG TPA: HEAT repeat domain-containing protein [Anaerolineaceae bacterium]|nr:HEAT repeat domain-containing protein [Anaerolineaceae bacterium]